MNSIGDVLRNITERDDIHPCFRAAIAAGLEEANDNLAEALTVHFWKRPYLLADLLGLPMVWPVRDYDLEDLLFLCRVRLAEQRNRAGYTAISLRAADKCLTRMLATAKELDNLAAQRAVEGEPA